MATSSLTSAHLHICSSSHLLNNIFSSSHLLIFTSSLTSADLHIFSHICSSSHLLMSTSSLTSAHLHICSSSHLLMSTSSLTSAHLHICSCPHLLSHLLIFTSAHVHIFSHICSSSHLLMSTSSLAFFIFLSLGGSRGGGNETPRNATLSHEMRFDRQKLRKNCDFKVSAATLSQVPVEDVRTCSWHCNRNCLSDATVASCCPNASNFKRTAAYKKDCNL